MILMNITTSDKVKYITNQGIGVNLLKEKVVHNKNK